MKPHYTNTNNPIDFPKSDNKMNERIHTLAEEAGLYCDGTPDAWDQEAIERFAELIVRECAQFIVVLDAEPVSHKSAARMLQDHFGVKE